MSTTPSNGLFAYQTQDHGPYLIIFLNSSSLKTLIPNSLALSNLEPGLKLD
jgi:hypothetical protein